MTAHRFDKGDRVAVFNNRLSGEPIFEGNATVERRLNTDHLYAVRFDKEPEATYDRFTTTRPGNEADDRLEELRAEFQFRRNVA